MRAKQSGKWLVMNIIKKLLFGVAAAITFGVSARGGEAATAGVVATATLAAPQSGELAKADREALERTIYAIIDAWRNGDVAKLNSFVSPQYGLAFLDNPGAVTYIESYDGVPESEMPRLEIEKKEYPLSFEPLPLLRNPNDADWDDNWWWDKPAGKIYCAPMPLPNAEFSGHARSLIAYRMVDDDKYPAERLAMWEEVETSNLHGVILLQKGRKDLIFYLSLLDGRWRLVGIDFHDPFSA